MAIDLRPESPTRGQWYGIELTPDSGRALYIPDTHVVDFLYGPGRRLSRPTLLWARDGLLYRLESSAALALASAR